LWTVLVAHGLAGICRDEPLVAMTSQNSGVGAHHRRKATHPVSRERNGWRPEDYLESHPSGEQTVGLPLSAKPTDHDVQGVIRALREVLSVN
jgi:dTDP-4-amino-4,6-dideoxygalactose transaminase